jgi:hypothetical protein
MANKLICHDDLDSDKMDSSYFLSEIESNLAQLEAIAAQKQWSDSAMVCSLVRIRAKVDEIMEICSPPISYASSSALEGVEPPSAYLESAFLDIMQLTPDALTAIEQTYPITPDDIEHPLVTAEDPPTQIVASPKLYTCRVKGLGSNIVQTIRQVAGEGDVKRCGYAKLTVTDAPAVRWPNTAFLQPGQDQITGQYVSVGSNGTAKIRVATYKKLSFPDLPLPGGERTYSHAEIRQVFEDVVSSPPRGRLAYCISPPLLKPGQASYIPLVDCGEKLKRRNHGQIPGVNTVYWYWNFDGVSASPMHEEDCGLFSVNCMLSGSAKLWMIIPPSHRELLIQKLDGIFQMCPCSQCIRHLDRIISPSQLEKWGIPYFLDYCMPGQLIVTMPQAVHQIVNNGPNLAEAINLELPDSPDVLEDYIWCDNRCGGEYAITREIFQLDSHRLQPQLSAESVPRRTGSSISRGKAAQPNRNEDLRQLAETISAQAVSKLVRVVLGWRNSDSRLRRLMVTSKYGIIPNVQSPLDGLEDFTRFMGRVSLVKLAMAANERNTMKGRTRAEPNDLDALLETLGWQRKHRQLLVNKIRKGRSWLRACGDDVGLLCFLTDPCSELSEESQEELRKLLRETKYMKAVFNIMALFERSIEETDIEFKWESLDCTSVKDWSSLLAATSVIGACKCGPLQSWTKPNEWPTSWPWPCNPLSIPEGETQCEICSGSGCRCSYLPDRRPRIANFTGRGLGLRAMSCDPQALAYEKNDIIGEIVGLLQPLRSCPAKTHRYFELKRTDLPLEPRIGWIDCENESNMLRLVNYSCRPNAALRGVRISGLYRVLLVALHNIWDEEEITASEVLQRQRCANCGVEHGPQRSG